ncbi:hypothetical protein [Methylocaldum sp. 14B]|uniref:hypothetical protein n=1 Tax=Methylocaldum sp. 14B TaxID=1912213 RepID=UPI00098AEA29|nr:hypothetical protein [Methylocaldum sp. 14B]
MANNNGRQVSELDHEALDFEELGLALCNALAVVETCRILSNYSVVKVAANYDLDDITIPNALLCAHGEIKRALKMLGPYGASWNKAAGVANEVHDG